MECPLRGPRPRAGPAAEGHGRDARRDGREGRGHARQRAPRDQQDPLLRGRSGAVRVRRGAGPARRSPLPGGSAAHDPLDQRLQQARRGSTAATPSTRTCVTSRFAPPTGSSRPGPPSTRAGARTGASPSCPGSHHGGLQHHGSPGWEHENMGFFAVEGAEGDDRVHVEMDPGDTLLFHPLLIHGSGRNRSDGFRRAIATHYASRACERPGQGKRDPVVRDIPDDAPGP